MKHTNYDHSVSLQRDMEFQIQTLIFSLISNMSMIRYFRIKYVTMIKYIKV